ncbi:hypothetical protein ACQ4PT_010819 [Festuca glaucescens]
MQVPYDRLMPTRPFFRVTDGSTTPLGQVHLPVTFGTRDNYRTEYIDFDVTHIGLPYNAILGYPALAKFMAIAHHAYNIVKLPGCGETITIHCDEKDAMRSVEQVYKEAAAAFPADEDLIEHSGGLARRKQLVSQERAAAKRAATVEFPAEPFKTRRQAPEKQNFIIQEVEKLKQAKLIREVAHPTWTANPFVAPKGNGGGRLCVDFTNLNKACPKDPYPLPRIDQIVDSTAGCDLLCFLDAFSGYHQIKMAKEDEEKTAFITPCGVYCYMSMPFGLKKMGATFQRLMRKALGEQMGRNAEAYVDDIVVKTRKKCTLIEDLEETFANLRKVNIKLNPAKCAFGVPLGKLLGFLVLHHGIEANPDKVKAIEEMQPPCNLKEMQRLTGWMAALGRFFARSVELQPFELTFEATKVIKSKALAEFTAEWTDPYAGEAREDESTLPGVIAPGHWTMHFDGVFNTPGTGAGAVLASPTGDKLFYAVQLCFKPEYKVSNNIAEYEGLLAGLRAASAQGIKCLIVKGTLEERLLKPSATPPVESNELPEELPPPPTTGAPDCGPTTGDRTVLVLTCQDEVDWVTELKSYLMDGKLPEGNEEAERVARQASGYCIKDGDLYRRRPNGITLKCVSVEEGRELLSDIHAGECGHHSSASTLAGKVYRSGFYWPSTLTNAIELVRACEACQFHAKQIHQPAQELQTIPLMWPFAVWGLDILGPFPRAQGGYRYLDVTIDKFTKWAEVEPARTIPARFAVNFIKGLVCRFGVPSRIITDNDSQFTSDLFRAYCASISTKICYTSVIRA